MVVSRNVYDNALLRTGVNYYHFRYLSSCIYEIAGLCNIQPKYYPDKESELSANTTQLRKTVVQLFWEQYGKCYFYISVTIAGTAFHV